MYILLFDPNIGIEDDTLKTVLNSDKHEKPNNNIIVINIINLFLLNRTVVPPPHN